jgi:threonine/homoserine/homoserine lactone efflux protein
MLIPLGLIIGFLASLPPGPINLLALSQAMNHEFRRGLAVGLTAALLDAFYCYIAVIGTSAISPLLMRWRSWLRLISVLILIGVAWHLLRQARSMTLEAPGPPPRPMSFFRLIGLTVILYISSPTLAAFWVSVAASLAAHGLGVGRAGGPVIFAVSCGTGSLICYLGIAKYGSRLRGAMSTKVFRAVLTALAIALLGTAILALVQTLLKLS